MSELSLEDVKKVAALANLTFSDEELSEMRTQLSQILDYVEMLDQVDTRDVEPLAHPIDVVDVFREDEPTEMLAREQALENAPKTDGNYFVVPAILDGGE